MGVVHAIARVVRASLALALATSAAACGDLFDDNEFAFALTGSEAVNDGGVAPSGGTTPVDPNAPYASAETCKTCHATIFAQWSQSMHSLAAKSPITIVQTNLAARFGLTSDPSPETPRVCVNCHAPVAAMETKSALLPAHGGSAAATEGVTCVVCHSLTGSTPAGSGSGLMLTKMPPGRAYVGPISNPAASSFHTSQASPMFTNADGLCGNCHNVHVDRNRDGRAVKGVDLVLQTTFDEYAEYRRAGGNQSCAGCHMPVVAGLTKAADTAPEGTPARTIHDHSFTGVDYPLDTASDPNAPKRQALLRGAAVLGLVSVPRVQDGQLTFQVALRNTSGHDLPTGFAFARQMWLEVQAASFGRTIFTSGVLAKPSDDLCDAATMADVLAPNMAGCPQVDAALVNIQLKLVDGVAPDVDGNGQPKINERGEIVLAQAPGARETPVQFLTGGPIGRKRPITGEALTPLRPFETRVFTYAVPFTGGAQGTGMLRVRLLFRNLPPYFLRALSAAAKNETVKVAPLVDRLEIVEMATVQTAF